MKILLIEDDPVIADFVVRGFQQSGYTIAHEANGNHGLKLALRDNFDLAIIDIMLPGLDGLSVIGELRKQGEHLPIIILSAKRGVDDRVMGLRKGSDDYLIKPFSFSELLARVEALLRRSNSTPESSTLTVGDLELDLLARKVTRAGKKIDLQPKEFSLLEYLLRNTGHVVSKTMIMERVWNYHFDPHTNVVEARVSRLREKIDKGFTSPLIHTIRGVGYILKQDNV